MTLSMKMFKDKVRFEWTDGEVESVVSLTAEDSEESALRKLKRVIALVEGGSETGRAVQKYLEALPRPAGATLNVAAAPQPTNGWAAVYGPPKPPEHWEGQVEIVKPGEDA
jgi:hypothetical protein